MDSANYPNLYVFWPVADDFLSAASSSLVVVCVYNMQLPVAAKMAAMRQQQAADDIVNCLVWEDFEEREEKR